MCWRAVAFFIVSIGSCAFAGAAVAAEPYIHALGSVPGNSQSGDAHVSDDGGAAAGYAGGTSATRQAFHWTASGGMQAVPFPIEAPPNGRALGISGDGNVVVGYTSDRDSYLTASAFYYTASSGASTYVVNPFGAYHVSAHAASADGSVIVGEVRDGNFESRGFRYTPATGPQLLLHAGSLLTAAQGVTPDGSVVVGGFLSSGYRWSTSGSYVPLSFNAQDVSDDGQVVVGKDTFMIDSFQSERAWLWQQSSGTIELGDLPGGSYRANALAVSGDGATVVGYSDGGRGFDAFIWDASSGMRSVTQVLSGLGVDMSGWILSGAASISADGRYIGGSGWGPNGQPTAWIAHIVPEPSGMAAMALGAWLCARRPCGGSRRRTRLTRC